MKEGWKKVTLGEIATDFYRGSGIKREQVKTEGCPCVRYGEIYTQYNIAFEECKSHANVEDITSPKYFEHGDILFAITGESVEEIGKSIAYLGKEKCLLGGDIALMKHNQNPKYLSYALSTPDAIKQKGQGKTKLKVVHTNIPSLKNIQIPLPPLTEQQRIVEYLDSTFAEIDALKAKAAEEVANAKAMFDAALREEMTPKEGWEEKTLGEICSINSKLVSPLDDQYKHLIHVGGANIESHKGNLIELKTAAEEKLESGKYYFDDSVVLYNKIRPYLVKVARPNFSGLCSADMYPLTPNSEISRDYLFYILTSDTFTEYAIKGSARAGMPKVNRDHLFAYSCMIPPLPVQQRIVAHLDTLRSLLTTLEEKYSKIMANCDALKQAILRETFE